MGFEPGCHDPKKLGYSQGLLPQTLPVSFTRLTDQTLGVKKVELANVRQGNNEGIAQFLKRAEHLADQIPNSVKGDAGCEWIKPSWDHVKKS